MPIYLVSGKLGAGKTLVCVGRIADALSKGRKVATNLDLWLEKLLPPHVRKIECVRLPDKPTVRDLEMLGPGNPGMDEANNGLIVLDELASWLNARQWGDKQRQAVIDWLIHSRKKGYDVIFICQHIQQIDKQVREALVEYHVGCKRFDRIRLPVFGPLFSMLTLGLYKGYLPKAHLGVVKYGTDQNAPIAERWMYLGTKWYAGYNTRQIFSDDYAEGSFSYLSPWHVRGRYMKSWFQRLKEWWNPPRRTKVGKPAPHLAPLMQLEPEARFRVARRLVELGTL